MASTEVERPVEILEPATVELAEPPPPTVVVAAEGSKRTSKHKNEKTPPEKRRPNGNNYSHQQNSRRFRHDNDGRHFKFGRKRSHSFNGGGGKFGPPHKRWKRDFIVPPTKFLLGGNICDPLNLNSLQDEEINRAMNAVTPHSSPLPTPKHRKEMIEVLIPPNIHDPLNLNAPDDDPNYELRLISPKKKKPRNRRRKSSSAAASAATAVPTATSTSVDTSASGAVEAETLTGAQPSETPKKPEEVVEKRQARRSGDNKGHDRRPRRSFDDKIVSPVIPQPGAWRGPPPIYNRNLSWDIPGRPRHKRRKPKNKNKNQAPEPPVFKPNNERFQYGNYNRYYGYRNADLGVDVRLKCFRKDMFHGKEVLDIGCNVGHITLTIARHWGARKVVGIDIDKKLLAAAKSNVKHYASCRPVDSNEVYPASMPLLYGPLDGPLAVGAERFKFPHNVSFINGNYVLDSDVLLTLEKPQFDVILCLSVTKWFHLNFGDDGLKRAFKRMHAQLRPGGIMILEAQPWSSYKGKKKLTETIYKNYNSIRFYPQMFADYLLSSEVGFTKCEVLGTPQHRSRGFSRPIQMFMKAELPHNSPSETVPSTACGDAALPTETSVIRPEIVHPLVDAEEWVYAAPIERPDLMPELFEEEAPEGDQQELGEDNAQELEEAASEGPSCSGQPGETSNVGSGSDSEAESEATCTKCHETQGEPELDNVDSEKCQTGTEDDDLQTGDCSAPKKPKLSDM